MKMMLQILKKLNYNISSFKNTFTKSLVAIFAIGLFAVNCSAYDITSNKSKSILLKPIDGLNDEQYDKFILGKSFFRIPWVEAPSATTARDGLGPLYNANTCANCHPSNGRGTLYNKNGSFARSLIPKPSYDPIYGSQIAINGIHGVKYEAKTDIKFEEIKVAFPDGEIDTLLKPIYGLKDLQYGPLDEKTVLSFRLAPSLNGLGLISQISDEDILKNEDPDDKDGDGISGRANFIYSPITKKQELGKFSWKANITSLKHQIADAANNDMGLTTSYYQNENCTKFQEECNKAPKARDAIDLTDQRLEAIQFYLEKRKTYSQKLTKNKGYEIFKKIGCVNCHMDSFETNTGIKFTPFTDLLLHDMGEGLADGKIEGKASGSEWRTAPLWGLSLHEKINNKKPRLLHDGRARTFQEAILWHDGEAKKAKETYMNLKKEDRKELLEFLKEV